MISGDFYELPVKEIMDNNPPLITRMASIRTVAKKVCQKRRHVWVVEQKDSRKLVGVITEKDLLDIVSPISRKTHIVGMMNPMSLRHGELYNAEDIMAKPVRKCSPDTTIEEVLLLMKDCRIRRLAITEGEEIVGELSLSAVIKAYFTIQDSP